MKRILLSVLPWFAAAIAGAVTFQAKVPEGTKAVYVAGAFNGWNASDPLKLEKTATPDLWTGEFADISESILADGYKYLCGPGWEYVEKSASGEEIPNRTVPGNPDLVGSWYHKYNSDIREYKRIVNGYERKIRVWAPADYMTSGKRYPVVYYTGVQQRYESAGSDNRGDDFFGSESWNAADVAAAAGSDCILVEAYGFVAENIPYAHPSFAGSGAAAAYIDSFEKNVISWLKANYPVAEGPASSTIMGADLGGLQAVYAALTRPDLFGKCVAVSPLLWLNRDEILAIAHDAGASFLLSYGSAEKDLIAADVNSLKSALGYAAALTVLENGVHKDTSWRALLPAALAFACGETAPVPSAISLAPVNAPVKRDVSEFSLDSPWALYSGLDTETLSPDDASFTLNESYITKGGNVRKAKTLVRVVPASFKSTFYWNIGLENGDAVDYLLTENKKTKFSSKKTVDSWIRVVLYEDGTVDSNSAAKSGFAVVPSTGSRVAMTPTGDGFGQTATVSFTDADKKFAINYGSVNSLSDMGAITGVYSVSEDCTEAEISYDYLTNAVVIKETKWGATIGDVKVEKMTVTPAVTSIGIPVRLSVKIDVASQCVPVVNLSSNYGESSAVSLTESDGEWTALLPNLPAGISRFTLSLQRGSTVKENVADVAVRILDSAAGTQKFITVNAYKDLDWASTERYKANFHTHTSQSFDTKFKTSEVVDLYKSAGYSILALTDHDANPFPWDHFDLFNPEAESRNAEALGMLSIPGVELSKDNRNTWDESTGGSFNHHNDFFTGRKGQEFASLRESYAYTDAIGGMQIINHPGQYWSLDREYTPGEKNSPEWHAENFKLYKSLVGLEVYNQGNRRPNDRILWDQVLTLTMPKRPVWGYSCDDTHTREQYFRNYEYMLMPSLDDESLKECMNAGRLYFSYEYTGSGEAKAPHVSDVSVDETAHTITVRSDDADNIVWIYSTDKVASAAPSARRSTVVGVGDTFDYTGYQGSYVRPLLSNQYGETCLQPFGFEYTGTVGVNDMARDANNGIAIYPNPVKDTLNIRCCEKIDRVTIFDSLGRVMLSESGRGETSARIDVAGLARGLNLVMVKYGENVKTEKVFFE